MWEETGARGAADAASPRMPGPRAIRVRRDRRRRSSSRRSWCRRCRRDDTISGKSLDDLNRDSPLKPLFFALDSADVSEDGQKVLNENAALLKKYPAWQITVEGHCDERGTAEYNLALGERRALAAKNYLVSLGIPADKVKVVSYGKEFPFEPGHEDAAWSKNRRAHFVITAK